MHTATIKRLYRDELSGDERGVDSVVFWVCDYNIDGLDGTTSLKTDGKQVVDIDDNKLTEPQRKGLRAAVERILAVDSH